jgi:nucleoside-diphosphate-sugar epimerase
MRVLITGAAGFVGRHLSARLAARHEVLAGVRRAAGVDLGAGVTVLELDVGGPLDRRSLPSSIDAVIHLAQTRAVFPDGASELFAVNTAATQHLLDYAYRAGARRFVLASSGNVYGDHLVDWCRESAPATPTSFYGAVKYSAELLVQTYSDLVPGCSLRLFTPYGADQAGRMVPNLASMVQQGKTVRLNRGDRPRVTPTHIDDVVTAFERTLTSAYTGPLNVAGDTPVSVRELVELIGETLGVRPIFEPHDAEAGDLIGDNQRMKQVLGAWPLVDLADGLARTLLPTSDATRGETEAAPRRAL